MGALVMKLNRKIAMENLYFHANRRFNYNFTYFVGEIRLAGGVKLGALV